MGVLYTNGFAIGTNPSPMNVNVHDWIIYSNDYVPAYGNGQITMPDHNNLVNLTDLNLVPTDMNIGLYINIKNLAGFEQLGNLIGLVGNHTRVSFTWGTSDFVTFDCTPDAFKLVDIGGGVMNIIYDQTYISNPSGANSISIYDSSNTSYTGGPIRIAYTIMSTQGFGNRGSWLLGTETFGCQPAWDNGVFNLLDFNNYGCNGLSNFFDTFNINDWQMYINNIDSSGYNQADYLNQAIGQSGTIKFTQGSSYITLGFDNRTIAANGYLGFGLYIIPSGTTIVDYNNGSFLGFNNGGNGNNGQGGNNEQYFVQPLNSELVEITLNFYKDNSPWNVSLTTTESNTTGIVFASTPYYYNGNGPDGPGYATGWTSLANQGNSGGTLWEFDTFSYKEFSTPQTDLVIVGDKNINALTSDDRALGITVIADALVGVSSSPIPDPNYSTPATNQRSNSNSITVGFGASDGSVIVLTTGMESNTGQSARYVTSVTGGGLTWTLRKRYADLNSNCGQSSEIWYAINTTGNAIEDNVTVTYNDNFDDETVMVTSWAGVNLSQPWTSSGSFTSNSNYQLYTPPPPPPPLSQFTPNGTDGPNGHILSLLSFDGVSGNQILDNTSYHNDFTWSGSNPFDGSYYVFAGSGNYAEANSQTYFDAIVNSMTIEMWVTFPSIPSTTSLISKTADQGGGWALRLDGSGNQLNLVKYNVADQIANLPSTLNANQWHHIAVMQGGTSLTYMVDGVIVGAVNNGANYNFDQSSGRPVFLTKDNYTGRNDAMTISTVDVYDYCRTTADVLADFENTKHSYGY